MSGLKKMYLVLGRRERLFCWVISMLGLIYRSAQLDDVHGWYVWGEYVQCYIVEIDCFPF